MTKYQINQASGINFLNNTTMGQKILIDFTQLRNPQIRRKWGTDGYCLTAEKALKSIREIAAFLYTCRKCQDAPCINACPKEALEKDEDGVVQRALNLCVSCKSCVVICPFGTLMNDFFVHVKANVHYVELSDEAGIQQLMDASPPGIITKVEMEENEAEHVMKFNEHILVKDYAWNK
jgi:Fe-S-cluster-containing dehydrogenase component